MSLLNYTVPDIPPSLNKYAGRGNVWEYRQEKQYWKMLICAVCRPVPPTPINKAIVTLTYFFPTVTRRDPDNYSGKMVLDGLTAAGIIRDDSFDCIELRLRSGGCDKANPRTQITVEEKTA